MMSSSVPIVSLTTENNCCTPWRLWSLCGLVIWRFGDIRRAKQLGLGLDFFLVFLSFFSFSLQIYFCLVYVFHSILVYRPVSLCLFFLFTIYLSYFAFHSIYNPLRNCIHIMCNTLVILAYIELYVNIYNWAATVIATYLCMYICIAVASLTIMQYGPMSRDTTYTSW